MRSLLLQIHLYAALLCSSYFVIYGISSLNYNHHFGEAVKVDQVQWERQLNMPVFDKDRTLTKAVRDTLGLPGWTPWWRYKKDEDVTFHFELVRPGKHYDMHLSPDGYLKVEEHRTGFWPVVDALHALMEIPNAPLLTWWGVYTEFSFWVVLFSAGTGIYLWTRRRRERLVGTWLLGGVAGGSLLFMFYIYWVG